MINKPRNGIAWLELLLALAAVVFLFQLFPNQILKGMDFRNWPRAVWFAGNVIIVFILVGIRFGPNLHKEWQERCQRIASERAKTENSLKLKKERKALERMQESRSRRIY